MKRIYFDNAATTAVDPEVFEAMKPYFLEKFGNPSSVYSYGREVKLAVESARKTVAEIIHALPSEVYFTSGGTESTNMAIHGAVADLGCKHIISSPIEHHATLHTIEYLEQTGQAKVSYVRILENGHIDISDLENLLSKSSQKCLVSLMHGNNEIGNITNIEIISELCGKYDAVFNTDTVQTLAHQPIDVKRVPVHFMNGAAHKFHGPKGVGILYIKRGVNIKPFIHGGGQERKMRAGTENVYGIVGLAKALQMATSEMETINEKIRNTKDYMKKRLAEEISGVHFNGDTSGSSLPHVLSVAFPKTEKSDLLLFNLDIHHICASSGSACSSGAVGESHVISHIPHHPKQETIRFSFSKYNSTEEVDQVVNVLKQIL